ncbi:MAG: arylsulfatase, partial [Planctomycetota bacterium]
IDATRKGVIHHSVSGHFAYRQGPWKLLLARGSGGWTSPREKEVPVKMPKAQLYNMGDDIAETKNLYTERSDIAESLLQDLRYDIENGRSTDGPESTNDVKNIKLWKSE